MKKPIKRLLVLALVALMTLSGLFGVPSTAFAETATEPTAEPGTEPSEEGEEEIGNFFAGLPLTYLDGSPFDTSVFEGKPLLMNIWATWCSPCIGEMPHLDELAKEYAEKIHIVGLHSEGLTVADGQLVLDEEKNQTALGLQADMNLTFPLINPDVNLFLLINDPQYGLNISYLPTTWLIDGKGQIRQVIVGPKDKAGWQQAIDEFLAILDKEAVDAGL